MSATPIRPAPERDPIGPFLHYLMAECGVSPHTLAAYRSDLMRFVRWRKSKAPGRAREAWTRRRWAATSTRCIALGLAPSSVCRHLASLSTFFRFLVFEGRLTENVAKLLDRAGGLGPLADGAEPGRGRAPARIAQPADTRLGRRDRARLETLYATGCRASEVVGLRPVDLDLTNGTARCVGKGNKERLVPLGSRAIAATVGLPRARPPGAGRAPAPRPTTSSSRSPAGRCRGSASGRSSSATPGRPA